MPFKVVTLLSVLPFTWPHNTAARAETERGKREAGEDFSSAAGACSPRASSVHSRTKGACFLQLSTFRFNSMHTLLASNMSSYHCFFFQCKGLPLLYTHTQVSKAKETTQTLPCNVLKINTPVKLGWNRIICCLFVFQG